MKKIWKVLIFALIVCQMIFSVGCSTVETSTEEQGKYIIEAKEAIDLLGQEGVVLVDMQTPEDYGSGHVNGAVNISRSDIVVDIPVSNMLAPKGQFEKVLGAKGISNDSTVVIYDNANNMDASRLWWTLMVYGHENIKVVSGGWKALKEAGAEITMDATPVAASQYTAKEKNTGMIATIDDVKNQVNDPKKDVILLDTRTQEEFDEGTIPGSILFDYIENNYKDGTFKSIQNVKIQYIEKGMTPDKTIIMYCKTSMRGAQTYLALYNAGYRNLKLYDGAWVEWSANSSLPVQAPEGNKVESNQQDNS
ncbi:MAG: sulfurtransferase [Bacillota bacterium]